MNLIEPVLHLIGFFVTLNRESTTANRASFTLNRVVATLNRVHATQSKKAVVCCNDFRTTSRDSGPLTLDKRSASKTKLYFDL